MKFKFDANQEYQTRAIESVVNLFEGQPKIETELSFGQHGGIAAVGNRLDLSGEALLRNLQKVQEQSGIEADDALEQIEAEIEGAGGAETVRFPNFTVEMETGTGKTYVYIRTALEMFVRYGHRKFIIVVPSVAVREGVLKALAITKEHLTALYGNAPYRYYAYDSENLSQVRQFALSDSAEFMVMTIDAFNKAGNVIRRSTDRLQGETPIHLIQETRPILILDEPQNMKTEKQVQALAMLRPLMALRYSATHAVTYNLVYRLTPFQAYQNNLVKRIEVAGVEQQDDENLPYLHITEITTEKNTVKAKIALHKRMASGMVKEKIVTVRQGDDLAEKAEREEYNGFIIDEINPGMDVVRFANGVELKRGEEKGADKEAIFEAQIRYTIETHFRKHRLLKDAGIKVLSLFFIDRVANYAEEDGIIRQLFNKCFNELKAQYPDWQSVDSEAVQAAYFAQKTTKSGETILEDSTTGEAEKDKDAYDLIMRDKERLLSFEEPRCFIFSHSALKEGWDNPNVFQICTLKQTGSEMRKRQEIGRGVRLAVNQQGERIHDGNVNVLTVIANESYQHYVQTLQTEIEEEYGTSGAPPPPPNARERKVVRLRKEYALKPEFQELWERIKHKTRYMVDVDAAKLVTDVVESLKTETIEKPRVIVTKAQVNLNDDATAFAAIQISRAKTMADLAGRYPLPDIVGEITHLLEHSNPPVRLTRKTVLDIFRKTDRQKDALDNPQEFAAVAVRVIKEKLTEQIIEGIKYTPTSEWYEMTKLLEETEIESYVARTEPSPHGVYDHVIYDSETERDFVRGLEQLAFVKMYIKLPSWFTVPTPVGTYNPDWAIIVEDRDEHGDKKGDKLYLVRETKGENWRTSLRPEERWKIMCGERHFAGALTVDYKVVTTADEIL